MFGKSWVHRRCPFLGASNHPASEPTDAWTIEENCIETSFSKAEVRAIGAPHSHRDAFASLRSHMDQPIVGQPDLIEKLLVCLLADGSRANSRSRST